MGWGAGRVLHSDLISIIIYYNDTMYGTTRFFTRKLTWTGTSLYASLVSPPSFCLWTSAVWTPPPPHFLWCLLFTLGFLEWEGKGWWGMKVKFIIHNTQQQFVPFAACFTSSTDPPPPLVFTIYIRVLGVGGSVHGWGGWRLSEYKYNSVCYFCVDDTL
jgi:hypothetical protein